MSSISIKKVFIWLIILLFLVYLVFYGSLGYFYSNQGSNTIYYKASDSDISSFSMYFAGIFFVLLGIFSVRNNSKIPIFFSICVILLFLIMMIFGTISIIEYGLLSVLRMPITPFVYMLFIGAFACFDKDVSLVLKKAALPIGSLCIIISFVYVVKFYYEYGGVISNSPQIIYLSTGFWPFAFSILIDERHRPKKIIFIYLILALALLTSAIYGTRSWIIQVLLLMLLYTVRIAKLSFSSMIKLLSVFLIVATISFFVFRYFFPTHYNYLFERMLSDSRSWQYREIFEQNSFRDLLFGKGMFATYESSHYGTYSYIDNGFVQMLFFFGLIPLILYSLILIIPFIHCLKHKIPLRKKMVAFVLVLWTFAIGGLSVYNVAIMDIRFVYIIYTCAYCLNKKNFVRSLDRPK